MSRKKKSDGSRNARITKRKEKGKENERGASQRRCDKKTWRSKEATARNKEGRGGEGRKREGGRGAGSPERHLRKASVELLMRIGGSSSHMVQIIKCAK